MPFVMPAQTAPNRRIRMTCAADVRKRSKDMTRRQCVFLKVEPGTVLKWGALSEKAKYIMADALLFKTVCGDCEWHEICHSAHSDTAIEPKSV